MKLQLGMVFSEYALQDPRAWSFSIPILKASNGWALFISTVRGRNHFYDLYNLELTNDAFKSFHFSTYDNPFIPVEEIDEAKKL